MSSALTSSGEEVPIEVASMFHNAVNAPRPTSMDFSLDGLHFASSHSDDAVRCVDVSSLTHTDTILCDAFGVHAVRYTHSSAVVCVAPRFHLDGHLHLLNLETAQFFAEMAYVNDMEAEIAPVANTPVYSTLVQCPVTDVLAAVVPAKGRLALFHPLISGCIACTSERSVMGPKACVQFSRDGQHIAVGDDRRVCVLDRRHLFGGHGTGCVTIENRDIFQDYSPSTRCKGVDFSADGEQLLLTSSSGEVVLYDWRRGDVLSDYFHDDAKRHFLGSSDAVGAQFVFPWEPSSPVLQLTAAMRGGRHVLIYAGYKAPSSDSTRVDRPSATRPPQGRLLYELQAKDSDVPVCVAVNPRFQLAATAARSITWLAFHAGCMAAQEVPASETVTG